MSVKWSTRSALADVILDELIAAARQEEDLVDAADVFAAWDRHANGDSPGYPLFAVWFIASGAEAIRNGLHASGAPSPGAMPTRLHNAADAVGWLRGAKLMLGLLGLPIDVKLADFAKMRERDTVIGADGGFVSIGVMKDLEPLPSLDGSWKAQYGDTYVGLVEFTPDGPKAQCLLPYGNVSEPSAPHYTTQIDLFAASQLRPVPSF
jgi:acyl-homoserine-lactone acylase